MKYGFSLLTLALLTFASWVVTAGAIYIIFLVGKRIFETLG